MGSNINDNFKNSNSDLKELIKKSQEGSQFKIYETQVNEFLNEVLFTSNKRDDELINFRLKWIIEALNEDLERAINLEFGGSHNKGTFVSGLSDIDALLLLNNTNLKNKSPRIIQEFIKNKLLNSKKINPIEIKIGYLAITVIFDDKFEIQLLPAIKEDFGYKIIDQDGNWSNVISPQEFALNLKKVNQQLGSKLVPIIKLVKNLNSKLPKEFQLKSYHIEVLGLNIFKDFPNSIQKTNKNLLFFFFENCPNWIKRPIEDKSRQSIYVDNYLGEEFSEKRMKISFIYDNIYRKLKTADNLRSTDEIKNLLF